ncbi:unnamed protein product, partial [marine sediment metagenome]
MNEAAYSRDVRASRGRAVVPYYCDPMPLIAQIKAASSTSGDDRGVVGTDPTPAPATPNRLR